MKVLPRGISTKFTFYRNFVRLNSLDFTGQETKFCASSRLSLEVSIKALTFKAVATEGTTERAVK
jgi:hypothetical protein